MNAEEANMMLDSAVLRAISQGADQRHKIRAAVQATLDYVCVIRNINPNATLTRSLARLAPRLDVADHGQHMVYKLRGHSR